MDDLIKTVQPTPKVPDALKKSEQPPAKKSAVVKKPKSRKDSKHIIDTYA